jgi:hypothetical protein
MILQMQPFFFFNERTKQYDHVGRKIPVTTSEYRYKSLLDEYCKESVLNRCSNCAYSGNECMLKFRSNVHLHDEANIYQQKLINMQHVCPDVYLLKEGVSLTGRMQPNVKCYKRLCLVYPLQVAGWNLYKVRFSLLIYCAEIQGVRKYFLNTCAYT